MSIPITLSFASIFALFALVLSFRAGPYRAKSGVSILFGDPPDMELAQRVRVHQNFLEYVPMLLLVMMAIEISGGSSRFLLIAGILLLVFRVAHALGLKHDNMVHKGRFIGAFGTALLTLVTGCYGAWLGLGKLLF